MNSPSGRTFRQLSCAPSRAVSLPPSRGYPTGAAGLWIWDRRRWPAAGVPDVPLGRLETSAEATSTRLLTDGPIAAAPETTAGRYDLTTNKSAQVHGLHVQRHGGSRLS